MAGYMGRLFSRVSYAFEFNQATLSGAIDIVVIADEKGKRHCSPFHVRFGKLQLLKARGLPVSVELNGHVTKLRLYLGPAGEAYFYHPKKSVPPTPTTGQQTGDDEATTVQTPVSTNNALNHHPSGAPDVQASAPGSILVDNSVRGTGAAVVDNNTSRRLGPRGGGGMLLEHEHVHGLASADEAAEMPVLFHSATSPISDTYATTNATEMVTANALESDIFQQSLPILGPAVHSQPAIVYAAESACGYVSDSEVEVSRLDRDGEAEVVDEPRSPPVSATERRVYNLSRTRSLRPEKRDISTPPPPPHSSPRLGAISSASMTGNMDEWKFGVDDARIVDAPCAVDLVTDRAQILPKAGNGSPDVEDNCARDGFHAPTSGAISRSTVSGPQENGLKESCVTLSADEAAKAIVSEDAKLELRSIDGFDEDDLSARNSSLLFHEDLSHSSRLDNRDVTIAQNLTHALSEALKDMSRQTNGDYATETTADHGKIFHSHETHRIYQGYCDENDHSTIAISLCGAYLTPAMNEEQVAAVFEAHRVSFGDFSSNPNVLYDPNLLFCVDDRLVEFRIAAPFIMSSVAFGKCLDLEVLTEQMAAPPESWSGVGKASNMSENVNTTNPDNGQLVGRSSESTTRPPSRSFWFPWSRASNVVGEPLLSDEDRHALESPDMPREDNLDKMVAEVVLGSPDGNDAKEHDEIACDSVCDTLTDEVDSSTGLERVAIEKVDVLDVPDSVISAQAKYISSESNMNASAPELEIVAQGLGETSALLDPFFDTDDESLSLTPSSEELEALDLQPGPNTIRFVVESSTAEISCRIFLWSNDTKIVISDVDGTITRSDVLGHVLPAVGRDWSHVGVAGLYTEIAKRGYKFMYLTARPIGQASQTRSFLHNVVQGGSRLPNGPVIMSPNRLVESFTREVIRRKPQEFKIDALRKVRNLFPPDYNPFHAGFGNRETDVISYRAVGLIPQRIFVVNPQAELAVMNVRYESASSYSSLRELVDSVFPDIHGRSGQELIRNLTESSAFNDWLFWKPEMPELDFDELLKKAGS